MNGLMTTTIIAAPVVEDGHRGATVRRTSIAAVERNDQPRRPQRPGLGEPARVRQRHRVRVVAAGQHRTPLRRATPRCSRGRRPAAVLDRRPIGQNSRTQKHRRGTKQTGPTHQRPGLNQTQSVKDQPKQKRQQSTDSEQGHYVKSRDIVDRCAEKSLTFRACFRASFRI